MNIEAKILNFIYRDFYTQPFFLETNITQICFQVPTTLFIQRYK